MIWGKNLKSGFAVQDAQMRALRAENESQWRRAEELHQILGTRAHHVAPNQINVWKSSLLYKKVYIGGKLGLIMTVCRLGKPLHYFFVYFFGGLECVGHSFAYVAHLWFLRDVWIWTQSTAVARWRATDLATHSITTVPNILLFDRRLDSNSILREPAITLLSQ